jgi:hypothetical protein
MEQGRLRRRAFLKTSAGIAALGPAAFAFQDAKDLFDGKTLAGWHKNPKKIGHGTGGSWVVEDGAITGEQDPPGSGNGGILLTDAKYGDFELQVDMKPDWGVDSGLFVRCTDEGRCFQMMVDYHENGNVGHVYGEGLGGFNTWAFNIQGVMTDGKLTAHTAKPVADYEKNPAAYTCKPEEWLKAWKIGDWNTARVVCAGKHPRITTWINGVKICEFDGETFVHPKYDKEKVAQALGREGSIAVQVHGGKGAWPAGAKCRWKNIRLKPL